jgi:uncharacterized protein (TIRG00374 family)
VRTAVILGTNLVVGAAVLGWILHRDGAAALALLASRPQPTLLALFGVAVAACVVAYAVRWRILLAGLGGAPRLASLSAYRLAGQSLSSIIPSAKLGGEPLRVFLLVRHGVAGGTAIASVVVDRALEMGSAAAFACLYAVLLLRRGVPELQGALVTVSFAAAALVLGVGLTVRRLRRGRGLVTAVARVTGLDRLSFVRGQMHVLAAAEDGVARLLAEPGRLVRAFGAGLAANVVVLVEYHLLLAAFGLPAGPIAVVAAIFATGAAHSLPVPAAVGVLEGAQMWIFEILGHPPEVGLAVGLAVRMRELVWILPGLLYLLARGITPPAPHAADPAGRRPQTAAARKPA